MYNRILNIFIVLSLSYIWVINSLIEIPLKPIRVKGIPKYNNFILPIEEIDPAETEEEEFEPKLLIEQGNSMVNTNNVFIATVNIGSRKQVFNCLLDTGSSITWVPRKGSVNKYKNAHYYDPQISTTSRASSSGFQIKYGSGSCNGVYYSDNFYYINNKSFRLLFGVALKTDFNVNGADGIIGLSHYYPNQDYSFMDMLNKGGVTKSKSFSLKFGTNIKAGKVGKFFIGKHSDFSNKITVTCPLVNPKNGRDWVCNIKSFGFKRSNIHLQSKRSFNIIFDTGTNMIMLPLQYYNDLSNKVSKLNCNFVTNQNRDVFQLMCQKENLLPDFSFEINGQILLVPKTYGYLKDSRGFFYSKVIFVKSNFFIIGSPFFFAFHTLFDRENSKLHFYPENAAYIQKKTNLN